MFSCCTSVGNEFKPDRTDFLLDEAGWRESWGKPYGLLGNCGILSGRLFLAVRVALTLLWVAATTWSITDQYQDGFGFDTWIIKLTHWSALFQVAFHATGTYATYQAVQGVVPDGLGAKTPKFVSVAWFFGTMVPVISFMVLVLYWVLVYKPTPEGPSAIAVVMHGGNFALVLIDLLISRQPYDLGHIYVPVAVGATYTAFTYIYYKLGGTNEFGDPYIYKSVDWSRPEETKRLLGVIVIIGVPVIHAVFVWLMLCYRGRKSDAKVAPTQPPAE